jgi:dTDP-4-dehydrorhamnose 3,5-epimerase
VKVEELAVRDAYRISPERLLDERGHFYEALRQDEFFDATGHRFRVRQANYSVSRRDVLRGIHGVATPDGQAKYVTCVRGAVLDIVVDLRPGSPTYLAHAANRLDAESGLALYIAEGLGHAFLALTDGACMSYLCSTSYEPGTPFEVNPLDPELDLPWELRGPPILSAKDRNAPTVAEAVAGGLLASFDTCREQYARQAYGG